MPLSVFCYGFTVQSRHLFTFPNPPHLKSVIEDPPNLSRQYLEGYRDGVNQLIDQLLPSQQQTEATASAVNESADTWGLQITKVTQSPYGGSGIRVAVLDTGLDLKHPDFIGRKLVSKSFIIGVSTAQDGNGHGTHCIGTACGSRRPQILPRYGVAYESEIYAEKVLGDDGSGSSFNIVDGINWAVTNNCAVVSMSLGSTVSRGERYSDFGFLAAVLTPMGDKSILLPLVLVFIQVIPYPLVMNDLMGRVWQRLM